jgi:hypothetical protein
MFDLNRGEWFVVLFILIAIVSAPAWPAMGEWLVRRLARRAAPSIRRD